MNNAWKIFLISMEYEIVSDDFQTYELKLELESFKHIWKVGEFLKNILNLNGEKYFTVVVKGL